MNHARLRFGLLGLVVMGLLASAPSAAVAQPSVTLIIHGFQADGSFPSWPATYANAIVNRAGGGSVLEYQPANGGWLLISGSGDPAEPIALTFNWAEDSAYVPGVTDDRVGTTVCAAAAAYAALRAPSLPGTLGTTTPLTDESGAGRPIHLIAHSRGASVESELALLLLTDGIPIDQFTTLDPHPVIELLDPDPVVWEGVEWADNYYRADGCDVDSGCFGFDFDGQVVPGASNRDLGFLDDQDSFDNRFSVCTLEHIRLKTWYFGTVDLGGSSDGDCSIERPDWYTTDGSDEGYFFALSGGGSDVRPCGPTGGCPDAGRTPLAPVARIANGDFEYGPDQPAGWLWHGGGGGGDIVSDGTDVFLELRLGSVSRTSNRFFIPSDFDAIELDYRIETPGLDDRLVVRLLGDTGATEIGQFDLFPSATGWVLDQAMSIPPALPRNATYQLELSVESGGTVTSVTHIDNLELLSQVSGVAFSRGDCNQDATLDISDPVTLLQATFAGGPTPPCLDACDGNDDGAIDISDAVYLLSALFAGGAAPGAPTQCGVDPTPDALDCAASVCP